ERISVGFEPFATVQCTLAGAAVTARIAHPGVLGAFEPDVPIIGGERLGDGVLAFGMLRAIDAPPRKQTREMRDGNAEHLLRDNVIDALLQVRNLGRQTLVESAGDFTQENARFGARVEELYGPVRPDIRVVVVPRPRL